MSGKPGSSDLRWALVVLLYAVFAISGVSQTLYAGPLVDTFASYLSASLATQWLVWDAHRRGAFTPYPHRLAVFMTWPLAVSLYMIFTRGWWGLGLAVLHAVALCVTALIASYATFTMTY